MASEAQEKYNDLVTYLDTHDSEEIKANLRKMADQVLQDAKEGVEEMKKEASEINVEEKVKQVREAVDEGIDKAKAKADELRADYEEGRLKEKVDDARESLEKGVGAAMDYMGEGMETVRKQFDELRKRLGI